MPPGDSCPAIWVDMFADKGGNPRAALCLLIFCRFSLFCVSAGVVCLRSADVVGGESQLIGPIVIGGGGGPYAASCGPSAGVPGGKGGAPLSVRANSAIDKGGSPALSLCAFVFDRSCCLLSSRLCCGAPKGLASGLEEAGGSVSPYLLSNSFI